MFKNKKFKFSLKVSLTCLVLIILMLRASYWQFERHQEKLQLISVLENRLQQKPIEIKSLFHKEIKDLDYTPAKASGEFDFARQVILTNRRYQNSPGAHILTPFKVADHYIIVNRGFVPLSHSKPEQLHLFNQASEQTIRGIIKTSQEARFFLQPQDSEPTLDQPNLKWLRVDLKKIQKQLPYKILPFYIEMSGQLNSEKLIQRNSDKAQILAIPGERQVALPGLAANITYPIPSPDKTLSPGRHLGYVYEWIFMALLTFGAGFILQLKR